MSSRIRRQYSAAAKEWSRVSSGVRTESRKQNRNRTEGSRVERKGVERKGRSRAEWNRETHSQLNDLGMLVSSRIRCQRRGAREGGSVAPRRDGAWGRDRVQETKGEQKCSTESTKQKGNRSWPRGRQGLRGGHEGARETKREQILRRNKTGTDPIGKPYLKRGAGIRKTRFTRDEKAPRVFLRSALGRSVKGELK